MKTNQSRSQESPSAEEASKASHCLGIDTVGTTKRFNEIADQVVQGQFDVIDEQKGKSIHVKPLADTLQAQFSSRELAVLLADNMAKELVQMRAENLRREEFITNMKEGLRSSLRKRMEENPAFAAYAKMVMGDDDELFTKK